MRIENALPWFFFFAFLRLMLSTAVEFLIKDILGVVVVVVPLLIYLLFSSADLDWTVGAAACWAFGLLPLSVFWLALLSAVGLGFVLLQMHGRVFSSDSIAFGVVVDQLLRLPNYGQEPLFNLRAGWLLPFYLLVFLALGMLLNDSESLKTLAKEARSPGWSGTASTSAMFQLLLVYMLLVANPGIHTQVGLGLLTSAYIQLAAVVVSVYLTMRITFRPVVGSLLSVAFLFLYPWELFTPVGVSVASSLLIYQSKVLSRQFSPSRFSISTGYLLMLLTIWVALPLERFDVLIGVYAVVSVMPFVIGRRSPIHVHDSSGISFHMPDLPLGVLFIILLLAAPIGVRNDSVDAPSAVSMMTYNIHFGLSSEGEDNVDEVADLVRLRRPSIVAFQEVVTVSPLNGFGNAYGRLQKSLGELGYNSVLTQGGRETTRNAIFSLYPIVSSSSYKIAPVVEHVRSAVFAMVEIGGQAVVIGSTHLTNVGPSSGTSERMSQARDLLGHLRDFNEIGHPVVLGGDFNSIPSSPEIREIREVLNDSWSEFSGQGFTSPADSPSKRIDYIFVSGLQVVGCEVLVTTISDHLPVFCEYGIV